MINRNLAVFFCVAVVLILGGWCNGNPFSKLTERITINPRKEFKGGGSGNPRSSNGNEHRGQDHLQTDNLALHQADKYMTLTFKNDELDSKDTNLGAK
jgi:hypothetical protein